MSWGDGAGVVEVMVALAREMAAVVACTVVVAPRVVVVQQLGVTRHRPAAVPRVAWMMHCSLHVKTKLASGASQGRERILLPSTVRVCFLCNSTRVPQVCSGKPASVEDVVHSNAVGRCAGEGDALHKPAAAPRAWQSHTIRSRGSHFSGWIVVLLTRPRLRPRRA